MGDSVTVYLDVSCTAQEKYLFQVVVVFLLPFKSKPIPISLSKLTTTDNTENNADTTLVSILVCVITYSVILS